MVRMNKLGADSIKEPASYSLIWNSQLKAMKKNLSGRITRDPNRKCSGGKSRNQRALFVRSSFDWAVCSEPLARLRRTRAMGIQSRVWVVQEVQQCSLGLNRRWRMLQKYIPPRLGNRGSGDKMRLLTPRHTSSRHASSGMQ